MLLFFAITTLKVLIYSHKLRAFSLYRFKCLLFEAVMKFYKSKKFLIILLPNALERSG